MKENKLRIAIISPYAEPEKGAASIRVNAFRECFKKEGAEVEIFAPKRKGVKETKSVYRYSSIWEIMKIVYSSDFDVVLGTSPPLTHNFFALVSCWLSGKKFVLDAKEDPYTFEEKPSLFSVKGIKRRIYLLLRRITYKKSDLIFFLTELDKKIAQEEYGLKEEKLSIIMNGTDTEKVYFDKEERRKMRKELGVNEAQIVLIYAGSLGDEDLEGFIKSVAGVKDRSLFLLFVVSYDKTREQELYILRKILKENGFEKNSKVFVNVSFEEIYKYFSVADIGIVPWKKQLFTSLPVKVFDYLSAGLPVGIMGPKRGELYDFYSEYSFVGEYTFSWPEFSEAMKRMIKGIDSLREGRKNRIQLIKKNFSRKEFAGKAFRKFNQFRTGPEKC